MDAISDIAGSGAALQKLESGIRDNAAQMKRFDGLRQAADADRAVLDKLEDKLAASSAIAAAASGTPEEAKALASKMRAKAMRAAADGADPGALEAMVRDMERLARIAEENREREKRGGRDASASVIPVLSSVAKP
jgi:hypothetical protein